MLARPQLQEFHPIISLSSRSKGIDAHCPQPPTSKLTRFNVGDVENPDFNRIPLAGGYPQGEADLEVVLQVHEPLILQQGKRALILGHSSGGWSQPTPLDQTSKVPGSKNQLKTRKGKGLSGGITGVLYIGALLIPSKDGMLLGLPFPQCHVSGNKNISAAGLATVKEPETYRFNDLDRGEAEKRFKTSELTIYSSPAGHYPHLSWTDGLVETVQDFLRKVEKI
ncbi:Alpha/Beta hydrolase protein [Xylariaceae sp. FL0255]|nr:Alpha/Beta hydrolase protein [Xylariaceae sp. FL0255]